METAHHRGKEGAASHKERVRGQGGEKVLEEHTESGQHCKEMVHGAEQEMGLGGHTPYDKGKEPWRWVQSKADHMETPLWP